jgi:type I restriction enzyme, R subunit
VRDDLETLVMDADVLKGLLDTENQEGKSREIEIKVISRLQR